jgi:hypothetical protein
MLSSEEWIKQTNELLVDLENQRASLQEVYEKLQKQLMDLEQRIENGHELVRDYKTKYNVLSTMPIKLGKDKSYPQMLIEIAKQNNHILNVADATDILFRSNMGSSKKAVAHSVHNSISRLRDHFERIGRGQYRFTNHIQTEQRRRTPSGVKQAVKDLKEQNPLMTVHDVIDKLKASGFDFKGKKPSNSVNMAWVALGYSKEGKQQRLPMENPFPPKIEEIRESLPKTIPPSNISEESGGVYNAR